MKEIEFGDRLYWKFYYGLRKENIIELNGELSVDLRRDLNNELCIRIAELYIIELNTQTI